MDLEIRHAFRKCFIHVFHKMDIASYTVFIFVMIKPFFRAYNCVSVFVSMLIQNYCGKLYSRFLNSNVRGTIWRTVPW